MISQILAHFQIQKKTIQYFIAFSLIFFGSYSIINHNEKIIDLSFNFISEAKAQEINTQKTQAEKIMVIKKAAKGFFTYLRFADTPYNTNQLSFKDLHGTDHILAEFNGKPMLINLWATWCAPCRAEMPELAQLKRDMGEENFDVMAINVDKAASPEKIQDFLQKVHADNLVYYRDKTMNIFRDIRKQGLAVGLPVTLLIDKNGDLIASFNGAAPWNNDDAKALIKTVIKETQ
ncbi:TlpA disulfide reductase family protein [Bartonella sp. F02]|uniref:TlpA disulfide reductase family protein n=1 Tax=Bartonella sp. F02 TaxID=2967262 RepID=UPI0022A9E168|nr:TlpA disulfide reductase family protein [Bartonella sp. F02]MCZ2327886.1 TlpA family protein disulfide reductase [Bartonella sp. F02]